MRRTSPLLLLLAACTPVSVAHVALAPSLGEPLAPRPSPGAPQAAPFAATLEVLSQPDERRLRLRASFTRPMRGLLGDRPVEALGITLTPHVVGSWRWETRSSAVFEASDRQPPGSRFVATLPAGVAALDGARLEAAVSASYQTAPFALTTPSTDAPLVTRPGDAVTLSFNDDIDPATVAEVRLFELREGAEAPVEARLEARGAEVVLTPRKLVPGGRYAIKIGAKLKSSSGAPIEKGASLAMRVPAGLEAALACEGEPCGYQQATLSFSGRVTAAAVKKALKTEPPAALHIAAEDETPGPKGRGGATSFRVSGRFSADKPVRFTLGKGSLRDEAGHPLAVALDQKLSFAPYHAGPRVDERPRAEQPVDKQRYAIEVASDEAVTAAAARLGVDDVFELWLRGEGASQGARGALDLFEKKKGASQSHRSNRDGAASIPVKALTGGQPGAYLVGFATAAPASAPTLDLLSTASFEVEARVGHGGSLVWVTDAVTGAPVKGVSVDLRARRGKAFEPIATGTTDAEGVVLVPKGKLKSGDVVGVVAHRGDEIAAALSPSVAPALSGWLFTERALYREGEVVHVRGVVRPSAKGTRARDAASSVSLSLDLDHAPGMVKARTSVDEHGYFSADLPLPARLGRGQLGQAKVNAVVRGALGDERLSSATFELRELRLPEIESTATLDRGAYVAGDRVTCTTSARYLSGERLRQGAVTASFTTAPASLPFELPAGFVGSGRQPPPGDSQKATPPPAQQKLSLGASGEVKASEVAPSLDQPQRLVCQSELLDALAHSSEASASALLHPAEVYVALRHPFESGRRLAPEVLVVDTEGRPATGVRVEVEARRVRRDAQNKATSRAVVGACSVTSTAAPSGCSIELKADGEHEIVARAVDRRGRAVVAWSSVLVGPKPARRAAHEGPRWAPDVTLSTTPGPTSLEARLHSEGRPVHALFTVEREGVLWHQHVHADARDISAKAPLSAEARRGAAVHAMVRGGRSPQRRDERGPLHRQLHARADEPATTQQLSVEVTPSSATARPGGEIDVALRVRGARGDVVPAEVTLYAVDEGVLQPAAWQLPDAGALRWLGLDQMVGATSNEAALAQGDGRNNRLVLGMPRKRTVVEIGEVTIAGAQSALPLSVRRDTTATPCWHAGLPVDAEGKASARCKLSDAVTAFRLVAVAIANDELVGGTGTASVRTTLPLSIRPSLPRAARAGDSFDAALLLTEREGRAQEVELRAASTGPVSVDTAPRSVRLEPFGQARVTVPVRATGVGDARITLTASGASADAIELPLPVLPPAGVERTIKAVEVSAPSTIALGDLSRVRADASSVEVVASASPLTALYAGLEQLIEYPYGCTEQLTSRLVPLVVLADIARASSVPLPADTEQAAREAVEKLAAHQLNDGSFGLWPGSRSDLFLTAYALWGLQEAAARGVEVRADVLARSQHHLSSVVELGVVPPGVDDMPFLLEVLSISHKVDAARWRAVFEAREKLSIGARATLLRGLHRAELTAETAQLRDELTRQLSVVDGAARLSSESDRPRSGRFASEARDLSLLLRALVAVDAENALNLPLALAVMQQRRSGRFATTQDAAWALLALDAYKRAHPDVHHAGTLALSSSGQRHELHWKRPITQARLSLPLSALDLSSPLTLEPSSPSFVEAHLVYAPAQQPTTPRDEGVLVHRVIEPLGDRDVQQLLRARPAPADRIALGETALVSALFEVREPLRDVAVDVALPAGLEAIDRALAAASFGCEQYDACSDDEISPRLPDGSWLHARTTHREVRADRVVFFLDSVPAGLHRVSFAARATTAGTFAAPPAKVEAMYARQRGASVGGTLVITQ